MDTDFLKTFLEINRTRHFGKAAENLFISQSTASARIRILEETIGAPVFTRTRNDIQLTPTGQRLLGYAESILSIWNRARQEITIEDENKIPLFVAGMPSLWDTILQDWLQDTHKQFPDLVIQAEVQSTENMVRKLKDGTLDIAFLFEELDISGLNLVELAHLPLIMVSTEPEQTAAEAMREGYILVEWGTSFAISHARYFSEQPAPSLRMGLGRMARDFLLECGGAAYLAEPMVKEALKNKKLFLVEDAPIIKRPAYATYLKETGKSGIISEILAYFSNEPRQ